MSEQHFHMQLSALRLNFSDGQAIALGELIGDRPHAEGENFDVEVAHKRVERKAGYKEMLQFLGHELHLHVGRPMPSHPSLDSLLQGQTERDELIVTLLECVEMVTCLASLRAADPEVFGQLDGVAVSAKLWAKALGVEFKS